MPFFSNVNLCSNPTYFRIPLNLFIFSKKLYSLFTLNGMFYNKKEERTKKKSNYFNGEKNHTVVSIKIFLNHSLYVLTPFARMCKYAVMSLCLCPIFLTEYHVLNNPFGPRMTAATKAVTLTLTSLMWFFLNIELSTIAHCAQATQACLKRKFVPCPLVF